MKAPADLRTKQYVLLAVIMVVGGAWIAVGASSDGKSSTDSVATQTTVVPTTTTGPGGSVAATPVATTTIPDLVGEEEVAADCTIPTKTLRTGDSGVAVACLQQALLRDGWLANEPTGVFDATTRAAVIALQTEKALFVDGEVGRESALKLGIWPDENLSVVRTPPPPAGAKDAMGFALSSVASTGSDAPPLPADSGTGRRLVYDRAGQRVWAVDQDETIIRSWLVSGSQYNNELPGTHKVYSKSEITTAWNGKAFLKLMVRWLKTEIGAIGFHQIPVKRSDGSVYQTEEELGTRLSGGCQRQAKEDAEFLWKFAKIGTPVVVI